MEEGEDDEDIATNNTSTPILVSTSPTPLDPIPHARAHRFISKFTLKLRFIRF
jgi:hypothetical protein